MFPAAETQSWAMESHAITQSQPKDSQRDIINSAADSVSEGCGGMPKIPTIGIVSLLFLVMNIQR